MWAGIVESRALHLSALSYHLQLGIQGYIYILACERWRTLSVNIQPHEDGNTTRRPTTTTTTTQCLLRCRDPLGSVWFTLELPSPLQGSPDQSRSCSGA